MKTRGSPLKKLTFLKLGGSLITDKNKPHTPRLEDLERLAGEIASAQRQAPDLRLLLGHGSGSFGHVPAQKFATRQGVYSSEAWGGFVEVWREAWELNRLVMDAMKKANVPAISFAPIASIIAQDGVVLTWNLGPILSALRAGLLPVVYGDVVFDQVRGGTIFSTEDLFDNLAQELRPARILLAGIEPGVWRDYPSANELLSVITPATFTGFDQALGGSAATDVTGGMQSKVRQSLRLVRKFPEMEVMIFSGRPAGLVQRALLGEHFGTRILSD